MNGKLVEHSQILGGGDRIDIADFVGVYTTAKAELPWPIVLVVWPPEGPPVEIRSHRTRLAIGRLSGDILVDDPTLDPLHCVVKRYRNGRIQIEDHGSYNGVWIDGERIREGASLRDGSEIYIGETRLKAWVEAPEVPDLGAHVPIQDAFDGLPANGLDLGDSEPLRPYAIELGPDYLEGRRRTFDDDVPTRLERQRERVDIRPKLGSTGGGYGKKSKSRDDLPDWAPLSKKQRGKFYYEKEQRGFQEAHTNVDFKVDDPGGQTLIHRIDRPVAPRKRKKKATSEPDK